MPDLSTHFTYAEVLFSVEWIKQHRKKRSATCSAAQDAQQPNPLSGHRRSEREPARYQLFRWTVVPRPPWMMLIFSLTFPAYSPRLDLLKCGKHICLSPAAGWLRTCGGQQHPQPLGTPRAQPSAVTGRKDENCFLTSRFF